jgi:amino acid adenylation domain-containing protein/thioester reductase-like protein
MTSALLQQIQYQAENYPNAQALVASDGTLTYRELWLQASRIASSLSHMGVGTGAIVAVFSPRTTRLVSAMIGIMLSGGAYAVVEDDGLVSEHMHRLDAMQPDLVLCEEHRLVRLRESRIPAFSLMDALDCADAVQTIAVHGDDTAYVLYTSGSTGQPKGVAVSHANIQHYTESLMARLSVPAALRYAHVSTLAADLGNTSLLLSLWTGGELHLLDASLRKDPAAMCEYLMRERIDVLKITPSHWKAIFAAVGDRALRMQYLVLGGEALPVPLAQSILASGVTERLINHYGPTETTVGVTVYPVDSVDALVAMAIDVVPIGHPFGQTQLRIRNADGLFLRHGVGELYVGGPSVSKGYVGNDEATTASFVLLLQEGGAAFYKTGDLVRIDDSGCVHFMGRVDRQVKVNGYRVELEHVEAAIRLLDGVHDAAVFLLPVRGKPRLVAVVDWNGQIEATNWAMQLQGDLVHRLPNYMQPQLWLGRDSFPRNENGKTNVKMLQTWAADELDRMDMAREEGGVDLQGEEASELTQIISKVFAKYLHGGRFTVGDNFFDLGGDSLDAIQLIAELQAMGHAVSAQAFLKNPTVNGVLGHIELGAKSGQKNPSSIARTEVLAFSGAQSFFLHQPWSAPDHYNQAVMLQCGDRVNVDALRLALSQLVRNHPLLRTAFSKHADRHVAKEVPHEGWAGFGVSNLGGNLDIKSAQSHVEHIAMRVQKSIDLVSGDVFRAHLFNFEALPDQLLLVAHHLSIDVISWRVLVFELSRMYADIVADGQSAMPPCATSFWDWVDHLEQSRSQLAEKANAWRVTSTPAGGWPGMNMLEGNTEGRARTLWLGFSPGESRRLLDDVVSRVGIPVHHLLLGVFVHAYAKRMGVNELAVEVESHGRVVLDGGMDISRVIGWHTSTYPIHVGRITADLIDNLAYVSKALAEVPDLGVACGEHGLDDHCAIPMPAAGICYNYLGEINFNHDERVDWQVASPPIGRARGDSNDRIHDLKLSARCIQGRLVIDLSFPGKSDFIAMTAIMQEVKAVLLQLCDGVEAGASIILESGTRTGLITYVPPQLLSSASSEMQRSYGAILLTGATGYVGAHVLRELLVQSNLHVYCLVRRKHGMNAEERLQETFNCYFPHEPYLNFQNRVTALEGDVEKFRFGLCDSDYEDVAIRVDAIYHFAADTRLFGPIEDFQRANVQPVQTCIDLAMYRRRKDLHYMSTLAVCGVNPEPQAKEFSEDSLSIGQEFQNFYESTKFEAECLVKSFESSGCRGFIYRSGNVSGHSTTAQFQRNARDNRFIQFLAACTKVAKLPRERGEGIVLSPIDQVAAGIVALSLEPSLKGGVFHVDSTYEIAMDEVFAALQDSGLQFDECEHANFASLFRDLPPTQDPDLILGQFWAARRPRNVRYKHERTLRLLNKLGHGFTPLDRAWLMRFAKVLVDQGVLSQAREDLTAASRTDMSKPGRDLEMQS